MNLLKSNFVLFLSFLISIFSIKVSAQQTFIKIFGDSNHFEFGQDIISTNDGGYMITGWKYNQINEFETKSVLIKTDNFGQSEWIKDYDVNIPEQAEYIVQMDDNGYLFAGNYLGGGLFVTRTDANGNIVWRNKYSDSQFYANGFGKTGDGNYILLGTEMLLTGLLQKTCSDAFKILLLKINADGDTLWNKNYEFDQYLGTSAIKITSDGKFIIVGSTSDGFLDQKLYLMKLDSVGDSLWCNCYEDTVLWWQKSILETIDKGYLILATFKDNGSITKGMFLLKTDSSGQKIWSKNYIEQGCKNIAGTMSQTDDGGYIIGGSPNLIKIDSNGNIQWQRNNFSDCFISSIIQTQDGGYALTGWQENQEDINIILIKTDELGYVTQVTTKNRSVQIKYFELSQNYPNPFNSSTKIKYSLPKTSSICLRIYNFKGEWICDLVNKNQMAGIHSIVWNGCNDKGIKVASGIYFYKLEAADEFLKTQKMILLK